MTDKEIKQFNQMADALTTIKRYTKPAKLRKTANKDYGLDYSEALEMAYENVIGTAEFGLKGIKRISIKTKPVKKPVKKKAVKAKNLTVEEKLKEKLIVLLDKFGAGDDITVEREAGDDEEMFEVKCTLDDRLLEEHYLEWGNLDKILAGKLKFHYVRIEREDAYPNGMAYYSIYLEN